MDPNETLQRLREAVEKYQESTEVEDALSILAELVDEFEALDGWLSKGGFLPEAWAR